MEVIRISVTLRLGAILCLPHDCLCGHVVDARGLHCFSSLKITGKTTRHNLLNDIVWRHHDTREDTINQGATKP